MTCDEKDGALRSKTAQQQQRNDAAALQTNNNNQHNDNFHDANKKPKTNASTIKTAAKGRTEAEDMTSKEKRRNASETNTTDMHKRSYLTHSTKPL